MYPKYAMQACSLAKWSRFLCGVLRNFAIVVTWPTFGHT
jgi:hypothetical protein